MLTEFPLAEIDKTEAEWDNPVTTHLRFPFDMILVFAIILISAGMMASNRFRLDFIALLVILALILSNTLTVSEALSGFGNPIVILLAGLLVLGETLERTGVARIVGDWVLRHGNNNETRLLILFMICAAGLSAVMSSTAVVAIFLPIVLRVAMQSRVNASRFLIPMSFGALISGMLTLIATPPNLVLSAELAASGFSPLGFFSFTPIGLVILSVAILYMVFFGKRLLPSSSQDTSQSEHHRPLNILWKEFLTGRDSATFRIGKHSSLIGKTLGESRLHADHGIRVLSIERHWNGHTENIVSPTAECQLQKNDILLTIITRETLPADTDDLQLMPHTPDRQQQRRWLNELGAITVLIHPNSRLIGKSLQDIRFYHQYFLDVLGIRRHQQLLDAFATEKLQASDSLLIAGPWKRIESLQAQNHDFVMMEMPVEFRQRIPAFNRLPVALGILIAMIGLSLLDVAPLVVIVMIAAMAAVSSGCLTANDAYRAIHWSTLILVAGMLPLADALQKTGGADALVNSLIHLTGNTSPLMILSLLFFLTVCLTLFLSNTASAVLMGPIAIKTAGLMNISPYPLIIGVLIAASCAFSTPMASPVVTLVVEPGQYRFMHFVNIGVPLTILVYGITLAMTPWLFPF